MMLCREGCKQLSDDQTSKIVEIFTKMKERDIALKEIKTTSNWFGVFFIIFCYLYKLYNLMVIKAWLQMII